MSEVEIFGMIGTNRAIFSTFFLCGGLMPLAVVSIAYLFRNFSSAGHHSRLLIRDGSPLDHPRGPRLLLRAGRAGRAQHSRRRAVRGAAMVSALIGVVMLAFFSMTLQNGFFMMLSSLSSMAGEGSEVALRMLSSANMPIGETITAPAWMTALSIVQIVINLCLTVYVFLFAEWDKN